MIIFLKIRGLATQYLGYIKGFEIGDIQQTIREHVNNSLKICECFYTFVIEKLLNVNSKKDKWK